MFIDTENTPNPATLKFLPGRDIAGTTTADYASPDAATNSPLALALFTHPGIARIFLGSDFITVTKTDAATWQTLRPLVMGTIMDHLLTNQPVLIDETHQAAHEDTDEADAEIVAQIKDLLDTRVRPAVASDGGDIVFRGFRDGIVKLHMQGACSGCPSSRATLKHGIENMLKHYVPEVHSVEQVDL